MRAVLHGTARRLWSGDAGAGGRALDALMLPAAAAYRATVAARNRAYDVGVLRTHRVEVPVISVGNIAVGGTGKTPFAHWLATELRGRGRAPAILHGGYAADEPALHRRWAPDIPVVVERDRVAGARQAIARGADVVVLDDAFQHRRLHRDLDIVLLAAERWQGGAARLLPRGPWREPMSSLGRAHLLVVTRKTAPADRARRAAAEAASVTGKPVVVVHLRAGRWQRAGVAAGAPAHPALVVAGLAEPALFVESARAAGVGVAGVLAFPDHHEYRPRDIDSILAAAAGAPIVTTEKDWTKLDGRLDPAQVWLLVQQVVVEDGAAVLDALIRRALS
jgi:tetraacyldisaccharide 4'-kinase